MLKRRASRAFIRSADAQHSLDEEALYVAGHGMNDDQSMPR